jgi:hypothetical protein
MIGSDPLHVRQAFVVDWETVPLHGAPELGVALQQFMREIEDCSIVLQGLAWEQPFPPFNSMIFSNMNLHVAWGCPSHV